MKSTNKTTNELTLQKEGSTATKTANAKEVFQEANKVLAKVGTPTSETTPRETTPPDTPISTTKPTVEI